MKNNFITFKIVDIVIFSNIVIRIYTVIRISSSGVARPKLMVGPDYRGTKEVLEDLALRAAPGCRRVTEVYNSCLI